MKEPLATFVRDLEMAAAQLGLRARAGDWAQAQVECRKVMGTASRLYSRFTLLAEMSADADFLRDAVGESPHPATPTPKPLPGDQPLPFGQKPPAPPRSPRATKRPDTGPK